MSSKAKNSPVEDGRNKQETEKAKRVNDEVDGEITISRPKLSGGRILAEAENKKKNKQQKKESNLLVKQEKSAISSEPININLKEDNRNSDLLVSHEKCSPVIKKDVTNNSLADKNSIIAQTKTSEKTREEIKTEREAKKKSETIS